MHCDAEDAWAGDARNFAEVDEAERAAIVHEWVNGGASQARGADRGGEVALDNFAGKVVERIFAIPPSGITRRVGFQRVPQRAAAVAGDDDRTRKRIASRRAREFLDRVHVARY